MPTGNGNEKDIWEKGTRRSVFTGERMPKGGLEKEYVFPGQKGDGIVQLETQRNGTGGVRLNKVIRERNRKNECCGTFQGAPQGTRQEVTRYNFALEQGTESGDGKGVGRRSLPWDLGNAVWATKKKGETRGA